MNHADIRKKYSPVLVEATSAVLAQMLSPDGLQGPHPPRRVDVTDDTDAFQGRGLDDGDGLHNLFLVHFGSGTVSLANDMGHAGLESHKGRQVNLVGGVILGESLDFAAMTSGALLGIKSHRAMTGRGELTVRLKIRSCLSIAFEINEIRQRMKGIFEDLNEKNPEPTYHGECPMKKEGGGVETKKLRLYRWLTSFHVWL